MRSSPIKITNSAKDWKAASQQLSRARDRVVGMAFSRPCLDTLTALDVTPAQVVQAAGAAQFNDALASSVTRASLYANVPTAAGAQAQFKDQTVQRWFQSDSTVMAAADLRGPRIFFRSAGVDASDLLFNSALLVHELLHNIKGFDDDWIESTLGIFGKSSDWITSRVYDDCF